jgi:hypothetical protein
VLSAAAPPPYVSPGDIVGTPVAGELWGVKVAGSYGPGYVMETATPQGVTCSLPRAAVLNPVGTRSHPNPNYQGVHANCGNGPYPLAESFTVHGVGVGVRQRGAAMCIQVTTNTSYTKPPVGAIPT